MNKPINKRLYTEQDVKQAWQLIEKAQKITLLSHQNPDADGISACTALAHILEKMGKSIEAVYPSKPEFAQTRTVKNTNINRHTQKPDLLIACDTANIARLYYPEVFKDIPMINIDHHMSNSIKGSVNLINPAAASTCDELFVLLQQWCPQQIDNYVAQCLLFGILYDTQLFNTQSTTSDTLRIAAELMDYGVNVFALKSELLDNKNPAIITFWGQLLSTITCAPSQKAAWAVITQADLKKRNLTLTSLVGFGNFLAQLGGVDITIVFYETEEGKSKVSLRSKTSDVNALANKFGGGGHKNAAGISSDKPIDQVVQEVTAGL